MTTKQINRNAAYAAVTDDADLQVTLPAARVGALIYFNKAMTTRMREAVVAINYQNELLALCRSKIEEHFVINVELSAKFAESQTTAEARRRAWCKFAFEVA